MPQLSTADRACYTKALRAVGGFALMVMLPVLIFILAGRYVDERWNARPWGTLGAVALSVAVPGKLICKRAKECGDQPSIDQ